MEGRQPNVPGPVDLLPEAGQQVSAPFAEVVDARREAFRVQAQPEDVDGRREETLGHTREQGSYRRVAGQERPVSINRQRREWGVRRQHGLHCAPRHIQCRVVELTLRAGCRKATRVQQVIASPQRHVEVLGEAKQHVAARRRATGLDKAEVSGRDLRLLGEVELAEPAPTPPFAQKVADGGGWLSEARHGRRLAPTRWTAMTSEVMDRLPPPADLRGVAPMATKPRIPR